ncbi:MAG: hypothetical protein ABSA13_11715 [Beijerinckiaceae bacterium]
MNDIKQMREKIAATKAAAQDRAEDDGPSRGTVVAAFVFVMILAGLALYFVHALTAPPAPILPPH